MINYSQARDEALQRKSELHKRQNEIAHSIHGLQEESDKIKKELIGLDQILEGLDFVTNEAPMEPEPLGFTNHIRKILSETGVPLVPTQIRDALQAAGVEASSSKNMLINVHTVLERIDDELEKTRVEGKTAYKRRERWITSLGGRVFIASQASIDAAVTSESIATPKSIDPNHPINLLRRRPVFPARKKNPMFGGQD